MLTVAELARELGTSTTTVYRTLKGVAHGGTESLTQKIKGVTYFTAEGERVIRECFAPVEQRGGEGSALLNDVERVEHGESAELLYLREQNKALLEELGKEREHSRQQAERLSELSEKLVEIAKNEQVLMLQSKNASLIDERPSEQGGEQDEKKSIWQRFFTKK